MNIEARINAFVELGNRIEGLSEETREEWYTQARAQNNWLTPENVQLALEGIRKYLQPDELRQWAGRYLSGDVQPRKVGVVMAGNIPAAGFHDMLSVLISGHILYAKPSSQDPFLPKAIGQQLLEIEPAFAPYLVFAERLNDADAVIATGSDNSARYFHHYFGKKPHIIRQNRTSCAVLTGKETSHQLAALGRDIFQYFGLGCRNVSKLYVPEGYEFDLFFENQGEFSQIIHHNKYVNNYDYNKSIYLINSLPHLDNGFMLLRESAALVSPVSVVYYETYRNSADLQPKLDAAMPKIQCVVSGGGVYGGVDFGQAQRPHLWDYADRVDTIAFLLSL
jgi:hypothetical protein